MFVIILGYGRDRIYLCADDTFTRDPSAAGRYDAKTAAAFCRENSTKSDPLTFADFVGEELRYKLVTAAR